jgi:cell wall-associated NlpC family hydrolase
MLLDVTGGWAWGYCAHDHYVGYLVADALGDAGPARAEEPATDAVSAAERFLGMTYLLGGRGGAGIDCSGLVQRSLAAIGVSAPRDSDMQRALGETVTGDLQRGDLISFEGHIGLMLDGDRLIHATAHHGKTAIEPLAEVAARTPILARKRL